MCVAVVALVGKLGDMFGVLLLGHGYVRTLLALNANDLHCVLTAGKIGGLEWFAISCTRRMIEDPLFFMLGRHHGDKAVEWLKRKIPAAAKAQAVIEQASCVGVMVDPGAIVCTMAGVNRMPLSSFFLSNFVGTVARLAALSCMSYMFPNQLDYVVDTLRHYQMIVFFIAVCVVSCTTWKFVDFRG